VADELTRLLADALDSEAAAVSSWHDPSASALSAQRVIARKRVRRSLAMGGTGLLAAAGVGGALILGMGLSDDATVPASPSVTSPSPTTSTTPAPTPSPTAAEEIEDWESVEEADKPSWITDQNPAEPRAREMTDWVWDYVDDGWNLWVFTDRPTGEYQITSQALLIEAPNGDQFRLFDLDAQADMIVEHWDPDDRLAWLALCPGGDSCAVVQTDLTSGTSTGDWGDGAIPARAISDWGIDGITNADIVGELPNGDELWGVFTYFQTYDGFFLRTLGGEFVSMAGEDVIGSAIESGSVNRLGDPGIEAWVTEDYTYAVVLLQWLAPGNAVEGPFHTSKAQWVVVNILDNSATVSDAFVPAPALCRAPLGPPESLASEPPAAVMAQCGGSDSSNEVTYSLVPLTSQATVVAQ
jgi:hypothetical protein